MNLLAKKPHMLLLYAMRSELKEEFAQLLISSCLFVYIRWREK